MAHSGVEKTPDPAMLEDVERSPTKDSYTDYESEFTEAEGRKIIHRIDRRLVVTVGVLYCISLMDRTNLSAAAVAGYAIAYLPNHTYNSSNYTPA